MSDAVIRVPDRLVSIGAPAFTECVEGTTLAMAMARARDVADELNVPVQVDFIGTSRTVYPKALVDRGYAS